MSNWVHIDDQKPEEGRKLFYFFPFLGVYYGEYSRTEYPKEMFEEGTEPVYGDCFFGRHGFLTDDVTHWTYAPNDWEEDDGYPDVPEGYIFVGDGKHREWAHEDDVVTITKYEYESLKEQLDYFYAGHLTGLVCQEGCPYHIYHEDEFDGYRCNGCGVIYPTEEVENNPDKYKESTFKIEGR